MTTVTEHLDEIREPREKARRLYYESLELVRAAEAQFNRLEREDYGCLGSIGWTRWRLSDGLAVSPTVEELQARLAEIRQRKETARIRVVEAKKVRTRVTRLWKELKRESFMLASIFGAQNPVVRGPDLDWQQLPNGTWYCNLDHDVQIRATVTNDDVWTVTIKVGSHTFGVAEGDTRTEALNLALAQEGLADTIKGLELLACLAPGDER